MFGDQYGEFVCVYRMGGLSFKYYPVPAPLDFSLLVDFLKLCQLIYIIES